MVPQSCIIDLLSSYNICTCLPAAICCFGTISVLFPFPPLFVLVSDCPRILLRFGVYISGVCHWIFCNVIYYICQWICPCILLLCRVILYVCICCYCCRLNVASVTCNVSAIGCELYRVWLIMVVMVTHANYSPMSPQSTIFSLDHYSWPYGDTWKYCWGIIGTFLLSVYELVVMVVITIFDEWFVVYYRHDAMKLAYLPTLMLLDSVSLGLMASYEFEGGPYLCPCLNQYIFKCAFHELYTGFNLSIALMVVCWWCHLLCINWFTKLIEPICNEIDTCIWNYFCGEYHTRVNIIFTVLIRFSADRPSSLSITGNLLL